MNTAIRRFEDLDGWREARELNRCIYACTRTSAFSRDGILVASLREATVNLMQGIVAGFEAGDPPRARAAWREARRLCADVRSHLYVALDQRYLPRAEFEELCARSVRVACRLDALLRSLPRPRLLGGFRLRRVA